MPPRCPHSAPPKSLGSAPAAVAAHCAAYALLALACFSRVLRAARPDRSSSRTTCRFVPLAAAAEPAPQRSYADLDLAAPPRGCSHAAVAPPRVLSGLAQAAVPILTTQQTPASPVTLASSAASPAAKVPAATARVLSAALLVGGARQVRRGSRVASRAGRRSVATRRAAQRQVGAKLMAKAVLEPQVLKTSYDASQVRTKLQLGLRDTSSTRSTSRREPATHSLCGTLSETHSGCKQLVCSQERCRRQQIAPSTYRG